MPKIAWLFPGQGSQTVGMCRALAEREPAAMAVFDEADRVLPGVKERCFSGPVEELNRTEWTQPALLTAGAAVWQTLHRRGLRADVVAGHSLGEYTALVAAGALPFDAALRLVRQRARFMQEAVPQGAGLMAAVLGLEEEAVRDVCRAAAESARGVVTPANLNGGGQIVIAGEKAAVEAAVALAKVRGARRVVMLPVSVPSHCPLMEPAGRRLQGELDAVAWRDLSVPLVTNVDAEPVRTADAAKSALVRQLANPVRWEASIRRMAADGVQCFIEVGPGRVLTGLVKRIAKDAQLLSVEQPEELDAAVQACKGTG
ncbi:MAG: ACP S-malonyltransferase [Nitrospirae bacterium]|nr:ACP S-malonyltransferase [Nitrospirota bacterium]